MYSIESKLMLEKHLKLFIREASKNGYKLEAEKMVSAISKRFQLDKKKKKVVEPRNVVEAKAFIFKGIVSGESLSILIAQAKKIYMLTNEQTKELYDYVSRETYLNE